MEHDVKNDPAPPQTAAVRPPLRRSAKIVRILSLLTLAAVVVATCILWLVSERTWWGTLFTFLPRHAFLAAPTLLLIFSLFTDRPSILVNLTGMVLAAGPLMGGCVPLTAWFDGKPAESELKVVSCNVQVFQPDFESVLREITALSPDVVALQEAPGDHELLPRYFPGWHTLREDQFWIGSRFPLRKVDRCDSGGVFPQPTALSVRIETPEGAFLLHDVHLTTPRFAFLKMTWRSVLDGSTPRKVESYTARRLNEALQARAYVDRNSIKDKDGSALPVLIMGDFNTPCVSSLYRDAWHGFTNAFNQVGFGFGYTAPCKNHRIWFNDVPWVRIDHILADNHWTVSACDVGRGHGSDHRLIWARLSRGK
jgi:endonuclease/exonuclease/phosphatase (EEP) superfamily protein YafD